MHNDHSACLHYSHSTCMCSTCTPYFLAKAAKTEKDEYESEQQSKRPRKLKKKPSDGRQSMASSMQALSIATEPSILQCTAVVLVDMWHLVRYSDVIAVKGVQKQRSVPTEHSFVNWCKRIALHCLFVIECFDVSSVHVLLPCSVTKPWCSNDSFF